jgi:hypothetical protein
VVNFKFSFEVCGCLLIICEKFWRNSGLNMGICGECKNLVIQ